MAMKRMLVPLLALMVLAGGSVVAIAARGDDAGTRANPLLTIRPEVVGCHSWSLNGGEYGVEQVVRLREGESLRIVNRDICSHALVATRGGSVTLRDFQAETPMTGSSTLTTANATAMPIFPETETVGSPAPQPTAEGRMAQYGAGVEVTPGAAGEYEFVTEEGASFFPGGVRTVGPDNTLTLHVLVFEPVHHPLP